jgi:murein DD-endopeptidase MepM/ murein hydrolase activator NlpD
MQRRPRSAVCSRLVVVCALVACGVVPFAGRAPAQESANDKLADIQKRQAENTAEIQDAEKELLGIRGQRQELQLSLQSIAADLTLANERLVQAQLDSDRYAVTALILAGRIEVTQRKLEEAKAATRRSAVLLYQRSDSSAMLDLIGSADGAGQFVEGSHYLRRISTKRHGDVRSVGALRAELAEQESRLDVSRKLADDARDQAAGEQRRIGDLYAQQQQGLARVAASEAAESATLASLTAQNEQLAADLQVVSDQIAAELARAVETPSYGDGTFIRPVSGPVVSGFGYRTDPITGQQAFHAGIDFAASCGTPIKAGGAGVIFSAGPNGGYGNATVINHGGGLATLYAHQSSIAVSVGQVVEQGQVIGYVGSTGKSTGCHLHFEVRVNGTPVNPMGYL